MNHYIFAVISTIAAGIVGIYLGAALNMEGYLGVVCAIAVAGGHIVKAIENRK